MSWRDALVAALLPVLMSGSRSARADGPSSAADAARATPAAGTPAAGTPAAGTPVPAAAPPPAVTTSATASSPLAALREAHGPIVYQGLVQLRANKRAGEEHIVGDNTDPAGMYWTKLTNLSLDLLSTLVAVERGSVSASDARQHVHAVLDALASLDTFRGNLPEALSVDGGLRIEPAGRVKYSSIDSAWLSLSLSVLEAHYASRDPELARKARGLLAAQDYAPFMGADGLLSGGFVVDAGSRQVVDGYGFSYGDLNSEARPLILALVSMGKLPATAWDQLRYTWIEKEGLPLALGWHLSAFVEMSGELWFDEMALAPASLGQSHRNYLEATRRVARRAGHALFGYAPTGSPVGGYAEYGLDRPDVVSPYAAALLALVADDGARQNLAAVLQRLPSDGRPMPDALDPTTGKIACPLSRSLDQSLLYLSLHAETLRELARQTSWYAAAENRMRDLDRTARPVPAAPAAAPASPSPPASRWIAPAAPASSAQRSSGAKTEPGGSALLLDTPGGWNEAPGQVPALHMASQAGVLAAIAAAALDAQGSTGGSIQLARSLAGVESAHVWRSWLELLPEVTLALRHEWWRGVDAPWARPPWWLEGEARLTLSPYELRSIDAAARASDVAGLTVAGAEHGAIVDSLAAELALYAAERRRALLRGESAALAALRGGLSAPDADSSADAALLDARLAELDLELARSEGQAGEALAALVDVTREPLHNSGLDLRLSLEDAHQLIRRELDRHPSVAERLAEATVELERSRALAAESRAAYIPELRARSFVSLPRLDGAGARGWVVDRATVELTAAFAWRPGASADLAERRAALEASEWRLREQRAARLEQHESARAVRDAASAAWSERATTSAAQLYADRVERFRRGELDVRAVLDASRARLDAAAGAEGVFADGLSAELRLADAEPRELAGDGAGSAGAVTAPAADAAAPCAAPERSPQLCAAFAEAQRARSRADAERAQGYQLGFEAGVLVPVYQREQAAVAANAGALVGGPSSLGPQSALDPTLVARASLDVHFNEREVTAARAEAELRSAQSGLALKELLAQRARQRLELAYARASLALDERRADFWNEHRAALAQMQTRGWLAEPTLIWQADLQLAAARERLGRERSRARGLELQGERLFGAAVPADERERARPAGDDARRSPLELDAELTPDALESWLEERYFPEHGLSGFRGELVPSVAGLELRSAEARLAALREPPAAVGVLLQGLRSVETSSASFGFGVAFNLDPPTQPARVLDEAERVGGLESSVRAARRDIEGRRREAQLRFDAASAVAGLESETRERLLGIMNDVLLSQATDLDQHESSKLRVRADLGERLMEAEDRWLVARRERARAHLDLLELGAPLPSLASSAAGADIAGVRARWVEADAEVWRNAGAMNALERASARPPGVAGVRAAGPALGVAALRQPVAGSGLERDVQASVGLGVRFGLGEGLAFVRRARQRDALSFEREAARMASELGATQALARAWQARERRRLYERRESELRERLASIVKPRYRTGHIGGAALADAELAHGEALGAVRGAEADERSALAALAARDATPAESALDQYARCAVGPEELAGLDALEASERQRHPMLRAHERRIASDNVDAWLAALGIAGPLSALLEWAAQGYDAELPGGTSWDRRHAWLASLILPISPKSAGDALEAGRAAGAESSQHGAFARGLSGPRHALGESLRAALTTYEAARRQRAAAEHALGEVNLRFRGGAGRTTIEHALQARDAVYAAEQSELTARARLLDGCQRRAALQRWYGPAASRTGLPESN
jgi:hypothetical protein